MISTKQKMVAGSVLRRLGICALVTVAWVVGFELVIFLLELIFSRNLTSFLVSLQGIPGSLTSILPLVVPAYFLITPYEDFKWGIQNGISRKTMWWGRLVALVLSTILVYLVDEFLALTNHPFDSWRTLLVNFAIFLTIVLTFQAIGNGFALLNRRWKVIVGIGLPVMGVILLMMLLSGLEHLDYQGTLIDYNGHEYVGSLAWLFNSISSPITPWLVWLVYLALVLYLTKLFSDHLQLRQD